MGSYIRQPIWCCISAHIDHQLKGRRLRAIKTAEAKQIVSKIHIYIRKLVFRSDRLSLTEFTAHSSRFLLSKTCHLFRVRRVEAAVCHFGFICLATVCLVPGVAWCCLVLPVDCLLVACSFCPLLRLYIHSLLSLVI